MTGGDPCGRPPPPPHAFPYSTRPQIPFFLVIIVRAGVDDEEGRGPLRAPSFPLRSIAGHPISAIAQTLRAPSSTHAPTKTKPYLRRRRFARFERGSLQRLVKI